MNAALFIEIGPLLELNYTGIANLTASVASYWLEQERDIDVRFFHEHMVIDRREVKRAICLRSGAVLRCEIANGNAITSYVEASAGDVEVSAALFCNVKTIHNQFDFDYQIIYDLTFLLTPEFHHSDTILYHGLSLLKDLRSNKETFCISECTRDDLITYCDVPPTKASVHYPGATISAEEIARSLQTEQYIVVAGTIEPRKNTKLILDFFKDNKKYLNKYRLVFIGRSGWLTDFKAILEERGLSSFLETKRIVWLNFVSDVERDTLFANAALTIYASLYEGFGLPVVEAMSLGCPVLASFASSIPEVGGDAAIYFDPLSVKSFDDAFHTYETLNRDELRRRCKQQASKFSWKTFNDGIANIIIRDLEK